MNCINQNNYVYKPELPVVFRDFEQYAKPQLTTKPDLFTSTTKNNEQNKIEIQFSAIQEKQGIIGKSWDFIKNTLHLKNSSNSVKQKIDDYKKGLISEEDVLNSIDKYIKGQTKILDFVADWGSTIAGAVVFSLTLPLFAAGVPAALGCAALAGGLFKIGAKKLDAITGNRQYNTCFYDMVTGGVNGLLSPIANGIGKAITQATAKGAGATAAKEAISKLFRTSELDDIIKFFALYTKNPIQGEVNKTIASSVIGQIVKTVSKFGLSLSLREAIFKYFEFAGKKQSLVASAGKMGAFIRFNGMDNDPRIQELYEKKFKTLSGEMSEVDFSNDVYGTKKAKQNSEETKKEEIATV